MFRDNSKVVVYQIALLSRYVSIKTTVRYDISHTTQDRRIEN